MSNNREDFEENTLCAAHQNEPQLKEPIQIYCIICSQINDPNTKRLSFYANARLCSVCAVNTSVCAICEEPLEES